MKRMLLFAACTLLASGLVFGDSVANIKLSGSSPYCIGEAVTITWDVTGTSQKLKLQLVKEGGGYSEMIVNPLAPGTNSYTWNAGKIDGGLASPAANYKVRVSTLNNSSADKSATFELKSCLIDPGILAKLRQMRVMVKWPPEPDPCLCPEFDLLRIRELLGRVRGDVRLVLLKNGEKVQELGQYGRSKVMPDTIKPSLSKENYGLLTKGGAKFALGLADMKGNLLQNIPLEGAEQKPILR